MELVTTCHGGKTKILVSDAPVSKQQLQAALETALKRDGVKVTVTPSKPNKNAAPH